MFIDDDAVEIADEIQEEDTQDESTEEKTTDEDASTENEPDGEIPEDQLFELGPITTTDESAEDESTSETPSEQTDKESVEAEPKDEVDKAIFGMQKRIDKVTAQKGEKDSEITALKAQIEELTKSVKTIADGKPETKVYTQEQLDKAFTEAYADGDVALMQEIRKHERENLKREMETKYAKPTQTEQQFTPAQQKEANTIERNFGKYADKTITEIYPGSHTELDIMNPTSALRRMAIAKYQSDPKTYSQDGGMIQAVTEAYTDILNIRLGVKTKQKNVEDTLLKNKVKKLQREKSQGSSSAMGARKDSKPSKPKTQSERTKDYVADRKKILV